MGDIPLGLIRDCALIKLFTERPVFVLCFQRRCNGSGIRFCAPGALIPAAALGTGDGYTYDDGTSLAAPSLAAAAADGHRLVSLEIDPVPNGRVKARLSFLTFLPGP